MKETSQFLPFLHDFSSFFLIFPDFFLIFGNFLAVRVGTLPPLATPVTTPLISTHPTNFEIISHRIINPIPISISQEGLDVYLWGVGSWLILAKNVNVK